MTCKFDVVPFAILIVWLGPALDKQLQQNLDIVVSYLLKVTDRLYQTGQILNQAVSPSLFEHFRQIIRPRQPARRRKVWLIRKNPGHALAIVLAYLAGIGVHCYGQKLLRYTWVHKVNIELTTIPW